MIAAPLSKLRRPGASAALRKLGRLWRREDGTATIEFALFVPVTIMIFLASVESGYYMMRHSMMERGLDLVMRDFRLGRLAMASHDDIRDRICNSSFLLGNCKSELKVWSEPLNSTTWAMPTTPAYCGDNNGTLVASPPTGTISQGAGDEIVLVRVCTLQRPLFPTTRFTARMRADSVNGGYQLATATVVVNEPR